MLARQVYSERVGPFVLLGAGLCLARRTGSIRLYRQCGDLSAALTLGLVVAASSGQRPIVTSELAQASDTVYADRFAMRGDNSGFAEIAEYARKRFRCDRQTRSYYLFR